MLWPRKSSRGFIQVGFGGPKRKAVRRPFLYIHPLPPAAFLIEARPYFIIRLYNPSSAFASAGGYIGTLLCYVEGGGMPRRSGKESLEGGGEADRQPFQRAPFSCGRFNTHPRYWACALLCIMYSGLLALTYCFGDSLLGLCPHRLTAPPSTSRPCSPTLDCKHPALYLCWLLWEFR